MLGPVSKLVGSIVGGIVGIGVSTQVVPQEVATPEIQGAITVLLSAAFTYFFPANK